MGIGGLTVITTRAPAINISSRASSFPLMILFIYAPRIVIILSQQHGWGGEAF